MREIKYNRKNMGLEIRHKRYVDRRERAPVIALLAFGAIVLLGIVVVRIESTNLMFQIWAWLLGMAFITLIIVGCYCSCLLDFEQYSKNHIKKRINRRYRKHKKWIL